MKKTLFLTVACALFAAACTDLSGIEEQLKDVNSRIDSIESNLGTINQDIKALETLKGGAVVSNASKSNGIWTVSLSDGTVLTLSEGSDDDSNVPVFKVDAEGFWIVDFNNGLGYQYILDVDGHKVNAKGSTPDVKAPVLGVDAEGYWTLDGVRIKNASGNPVKAEVSAASADSYFKSVSVDGGYLVLVLKNDDVIRVPYSEGFTCSVEAEPQERFGYGETLEFNVNLSNAVNAYVLKPEGWKVVLSSDVLSVTAPAAATKAVIYDSESTITLVAVSQNGYTATSSFGVVVSALPSKPTSYYQIYEAGEDIVINGVTYNKTTHPESLVVEEASLTAINAAGKIVFLKNDVTINTYPHFENSVIIGDKIGSRVGLVVPSGKQVVLDKSGTTVLFNVDLEYGHTYLFNTQVEYDGISLVNCSVRCSNASATTMIAVNNGSNTLKSLEFIDSELCVGVSGSTFVNHNSKTVAMDKFVLRNNIIYGAAGVQDFEFLKNAGNNTTVANVEMVGNTLFNIWHAGWFGFLNCNAGKVTLKNNLYVTSGDSSNTYRQLLYCAITNGTDPEYDVAVGTNYFYTDMLNFAACKQAGGNNLDAATRCTVWPFEKDASQVAATKDFSQVPGYKKIGASR